MTSKKEYEKPFQHENELAEKKTIRDIIESSSSYIFDVDTEEEDDVLDYCDVKMMQIARNLREVWNQKEYSISQLADKSGVTANNIYKMEKDFKNISVKTLLKLCKGLEVKVTDIISEDNSNQEVSDAEVFAYLTESLTATEKNAILEVVRICKGFKQD